jgi:Holliday junction resolvase RusA-like endonuclease
MIEFTVYGEPKGKSRPRFGNGHTYTPKTTTEYEKTVLAAYMDKYHTLMLKSEICVQIRAYMGIPKSTPKKRRAEMLGKGVLKKPDVDNIAKIILDALNGVAYEDDKQITRLDIEKRYSDTPRVEVQIREKRDD